MKPHPLSLPLFLILLLAPSHITGCSDIRDPQGNLRAQPGGAPELSDTIAGPQANPYKAPLYWSVYENHILQPDDHLNYITEEDWSDNIDWVEENLLPYGYDMVAIDGWGDTSQFNEYGYRTTHSRYWEHDYAWWAENLQSRGMNLGMYFNP
ncbi:MAG: DUF5116 domain-containing protein, partial [Cyclonatronaceae bacterium]